MGKHERHGILIVNALVSSFESTRLPIGIVVFLGKKVIIGIFRIVLQVKLLEDSRHLMLFDFGSCGFDFLPKFCI